MMLEKSPNDERLRMTEPGTMVPSDNGQIHGSSVDPAFVGFAESVPVPMLLLTPDLRIQYANAAFAKALDARAAHHLHEMIPAHWWTHPQEALARMQELVRHATQSEAGPEPERFSMRSTAGSEIHMEVHVAPLAGISDGPSTTLVATFLKIDDRENPLQERAPQSPWHGELLETSNDLVFVLDRSGCFRFVNGSWQEHVGYAAHEVIGTPGLDLVCPEFHTLCREQLSLVHAGLHVENLLFRSKTRQGGDIDVLVNLTPVFDRDGNVIEVLGAGRDITELRQIQDELKRSEERLRILFEYAPDGYYLCDMQGRFVDGNRAAERISGYPREELIGKSFLQANLLPKHQLPKAAALLARSALGKSIGPSELTLLRKDGTPVAIEICAHRVTIEGQKLLLGIARDITERKRAQEELRREKDFADSVINSMPGVFYMFDEAGRYVWWNKNFEEVTEYSAAELPCIHPTRLFEGADRERIAEAIARTFAEGRAAVEADLVSKSGRRKPHLFTGVRAERNGRPYIIGTGTDISERRRAQASLEKLNAELKSSVHELEQSNTELRDFAHVTAHDLKAPLRGIGTLVDWLAQDHGDRLGHKGRENLQLLRERVDRMGRLVSGILRYSEIGHRRESTELLDTHALVEEAIEMLGPPENVEIRIEGRLPRVRAEKTRLIQVFENLIGNAVKYMDKPECRIRIDAGNDGNGWTFRVSDNGPGIDAKDFTRVFQMFQTLQPADRSDSTGLGLAVVKKIVEMHGGRIWLESEVGRGSTFFFTLPIEKQRTDHETFQTSVVD
jgi:two-component system sensor kinase FixL